MWTVVETPLPSPIPSLPNEKIRHLVEAGAEEATCGQDVGAARTIRGSWARAANHCPACDQVAAAMGIS